MMLLKAIIRNKYKSIAAILLLLLLLDGWTHKGQLRVLFPKDFGSAPPGDTLPASFPLQNTGKYWVKGINTPARFNKLDNTVSGFECDVYFNQQENSFEVRHDANEQTQVRLHQLLELYALKKMQCPVWLDFKNCSSANNRQAVQLLRSYQQQYGLQQKILVESSDPGALAVFSDSGFFTSYYVPRFNPYLLDADSLEKWKQRLSHAFSISHAHALSGYYFQYPFVKSCFPGFPVLTWAPRKSFSLVNWFFRRKLDSDPALYIILEEQD